MANKKIFPGGMIRCLVATILNYDGPETEGAIINCQYCGEKDQAIYRDGAWHWNSTPKSQEEQQQ